MECTVPSPWKVIMAQETPNAILNEMCHPGECHMNQCHMKKRRRIFVSAEEILLSVGKKILMGYSNVDFVSEKNIS